MALVLTRKAGESILIGSPSTKDGSMPIRIVISEVRGGKVRVAIEAPNGIQILREELLVECKECKRRVYPWDAGYKEALCITHQKP